MIFYVGTYTRLDGPGIAVCAIADGRLQLLRSTMLPDPTYVILSGNQETLFAVSSEAVHPDEAVHAADEGSVAAYRVSGKQLVLLSRQNAGGAGPCHLCLSADERFLYTANYTGGSLTVFPVSGSGLGPRIQLIQHHGKSVHPARQERPHVHQVTFVPGTHLLTAVDLGLDAVFTYNQDPLTGLLSPAGRLDCAPGSGPRHLAYGKNGMAYLANELGNSVSVLQFQDHCFGWRQTLSTLPDDWSGVNSCAAIRVADQFVLVSNRGHDSLAVFQVLIDGQLHPSGIFRTGGGIPRDFMPLPGGQILVAHQAGDISLLHWDGTAGLVRLADPLPIPGAVCVCPAAPGSNVTEAAHGGSL